MSNAQTRVKGNPHNDEVYTFVRYVRRLRPDIFAMENVPGLDFFNGGKLKEDVLNQFHIAGYRVDVGLLNAADFGVPQKRQRLIFLGNRIHLINVLPPAMVKPKDWVTVREAISDLPTCGVVDDDRMLPYNAGRPSAYAARMRVNGSTHVFNNLYSAAGELVRERYKHIPEGGNWRDIPARLMRNYADKTRCHRVIYRRLASDEPARALPHIRKSMFIHPTENRGLTVREAARLQSFPDNFVFKGGIQAQQQQIANAVPPLLAEALASTIMSRMIRSHMPLANLRNMAPDLLPRRHGERIAASGQKLFVYFRSGLVRWGKHNRRNPPWRKTTDPFRILVAEVLLQKTGVNLARAAYTTITSKYPDLESLARADVSALKKMTAVIGLPKRASKLKTMAQALIRDFHGIIPKDRIQLASLPGVGPYTASAVACFGFGQQVPLVDSNIVRVFGRFFDYRSTASRPRTDPSLWRFAAQIIPKRNAIVYHEALLDFSAAVCTDKRPKCESCPIRKRCATYKKLA